MTDAGAMSDEALAPFRLDGKTAFITGAASGVGRATAELFARVGAAVVIANLNQEAARAAAAAVSTIGPSIDVATDVADEASVKRSFVLAAARFGGVDILVNNAA